MRSERLPPALLAAACLAAAAPSLLAFNVSPSPTFLNQAFAYLSWGLFVAIAPPSRRPRGVTPAQVACLVLGAGIVTSWAMSGLALTLALSAAGTLLAALLLLTAGSAPAVRSADNVILFSAFASGWLASGVLNAGIAAVQVFAPDLPDGDWVAISGIAGRAVGNLRQPNHLSSLLLWSCIAVVALLELRRLALRPATALMAAFVFAVVLTASRTGLVSVLLLGLWGLLDGRLARPTRALLLSTPAVYALTWWGMAQWAAAAAHSFGGTARLAESDISGSRFGIWQNTWALIQAQPWTGVGFGEFNLAWTLTPFPGRPTAFFDHTHNLPLQLAVELGLPLAALVMALLLWALVRAARLAWQADDDSGRARRCALMMVLMIGLHSLLEYPLWYAYFLLPTAWALGFALREPAPPAQPDAAPTTAVPWLTFAGWLLLAGAVFSVWDYGRVAAIFSAKAGDPPLAQRVERGQRSVFFGHHADYAAVTSGVPVADPAHAFDRASHYLLDTRLMIAWAQSLAALGEADAARHIAERLREFKKTDAEEFFAPCPERAVAAGAAAAGLPFQCVLPSRTLSWREFLPRR